MRQTLLLFCFVGLALLAAALLAYPLYAVLQIFTQVPFHKVLSQLGSLSGLLFIFLYLRVNRILNRTVAGFNLTKTRPGNDITTGLCLGIVIILVLEGALVLLGIHIPEPELDSSPAAILDMVAGAVAAGVMVALIEETLYRGALLGGLAEKTGKLNGIIISSMIYAAVHFIRFPRVDADMAVNGLTGIISLAGAFQRFTDPAILDEFLALFAFGVLLALVRLKKGNILQCMGIHAGVVMTIKIMNDLTDYSHAARFGYLVNTYNHQLGYLAFAWLCILIIVYCRLFSANRSSD